MQSAIHVIKTTTKPFTHTHARTALAHTFAPLRSSILFIYAAASK